MLMRHHTSLERGPNVGPIEKMATVHFHNGVEYCKLRIFRGKDGSIATFMRKRSRLEYWGHSMTDIAYQALLMGFLKLNRVRPGMGITFRHIDKATDEGRSRVLMEHALDVARALDQKDAGLFDELMSNGGGE